MSVRIFESGGSCPGAWAGRWQAVAIQRVTAVRSCRGGTMGGREPSSSTELIYSISLAQSAINGPCFGNTHLGPANQRGRVGGVGIAVTDEALRTVRLVDHRFEDPTISCLIAIVVDYVNSDTRTATSSCHP